MQPIALVVLDQGGNVMNAPKDMFVVEDSKPANKASEDLANARRQVTSNQEEKSQANNGVFYDVQLNTFGYQDYAGRYSSPLPWTKRH